MMIQVLPGTYVKVVGTANSCISVQHEWIYVYNMNDVKPMYLLYECMEHDNGTMVIMEWLYAT